MSGYKQWGEAEITDVCPDEKMAEAPDFTRGSRAALFFCGARACFP